MVFGELVPKNLAIARPLATGAAVQGFLRGFTRCSRRSIHSSTAPPTPSCAASASSPRRSWPRRARRRNSPRSSPLGRSRARSTGRPRRCCERSLAFGDRRADDVMTPPGGSRPALRPTRSSRHRGARPDGLSRFPVLGEAPTRSSASSTSSTRCGCPATARDRPRSATSWPTPSSFPRRRLDPLLDRCAGPGSRWRSWSTSTAASTASSRSRTSSRRSSATSATSTTAATRRSGCEGERRQLDRLRAAALRRDRRHAASAAGGEDYETLAGLITTRLGRVPGGGAVVASSRDGQRSRDSGPADRVGASTAYASTESGWRSPGRGRRGRGGLP